MIRRVIWVMVLVTILPACGETASEEAFDPAVLTYRLLPGSEVRATPAGGEEFRPEPLTGEFDVGCQLARNGSFAFHITRLDLRSKSVTVSGHEGVLRDSTLTEPELSVSFVADVAINGVDLRLNWQGSGDAYTFNPIRFHGIQPSGGGYTLVINAAPIRDRICCLYDPQAPDCAPLYQPSAG